MWARRGRALAFVALGFLFLPPAFSQAADESAPSGSWAWRSSAAAASDSSRILLLYGRVLADNGDAPEGSAIVELVCGHALSAQAYTDRKGRFSLMLGGNPMTIADASKRPEPAYPGITVLSTCELEVRNPGYRSATVVLDRRGLGDEPNLGTIFFHRIAAAEDPVVSVATLAAPNNARKAFEKGRQKLAKNKPAEALKDFRHAVDLYPNYSTAWCELGKLHGKAGRVDDAAASFQSAIRADPEFVQPYLYLSALQALAGRWKESAATAERALALDPHGSPEAYFFNAIGNYETGQLDAAEKSARAGERVDPTHRCPSTWLLLGTILEERKEHAAAAEQLRVYTKYFPDEKEKGSLSAQTWIVAKASKIAKAYQTSSAEALENSALR